MMLKINRIFEKSYLELIAAVVLFLLVCLVYKDQKRISYNSGQGWDGAYYTRMSEQILTGTWPIKGETPFVKRIGTPGLIAWFSGITGANILDSAFYINLFGALLSVLLLVFWLRKFIHQWWIRLLLVFLFMMAYHVPLRFTFYHPQGTDSWGTVFLMGGLMVLNHISDHYTKTGRFNAGNILIFSVIISAGVFFRETNSVLSILPFFVMRPFRLIEISPRNITGSRIFEICKNVFNLYWSKRSLILLLPIVFSLFSMYAVSLLTTDSGEQKWSYFRTVITFFYSRSLPEYLLGLLNAYGPLLLLVPFYYSEYKLFFRERQDLGMLLLLALILAFIGGPSTERISFMNGFPVLFIIMGVSINQLYRSSQRWWLFILLFLQSIAFRFFWNLPDYPAAAGKPPVPFFTLMGDDFNLLYLLSYHGHGHIIVNTILFLEYLALFAITYLIIVNKVKWPLVISFRKANMTIK